MCYWNFQFSDKKKIEGITLIFFVRYYEAIFYYKKNVLYEKYLWVHIILYFFFAHALH